MLDLFNLCLYNSLHFLSFFGGGSGENLTRFFGVAFSMVVLFGGVVVVVVVKH